MMKHKCKRRDVPRERVTKVTSRERPCGGPRERENNDALQTLRRIPRLTHPTICSADDINVVLVDAAVTEA